MVEIERALWLRVGWNLYPSCRVTRLCDMRDAKDDLFFPSFLSSRANSNIAKEGGQAPLIPTLKRCYCLNNLVLRAFSCLHRVDGQEVMGPSII